ncbi:MAG: hypothetical protein IKE59_04625 [Erysipelotrichaceae bacterium]|nr:hypothetical protein [Erysipelotrichaceae bacterium]
MYSNLRVLLEKNRIKKEEVSTKVLGYRSTKNLSDRLNNNIKLKEEEILRLEEYLKSKGIEVNEHTFEFTPRERKEKKLSRFSTLLNERMKKLDYSNGQLADELYSRFSTEVSEETISKWRNNKIKGLPKAELLYPVCRILNIDLGFLLYEESISKTKESGLYEFTQENSAYEYELFTKRIESFKNIRKVTDVLIDTVLDTEKSMFSNVNDIEKFCSSEDIRNYLASNITPILLEIIDCSIRFPAFYQKGWSSFKILEGMEGVRCVNNYYFNFEKENGDFVLKKEPLENLRMPYYLFDIMHYLSDKTNLYFDYVKGVQDEKNRLY